jgi:hypothetical protein
MIFSEGMMHYYYDQCQTILPERKKELLHTHDAPHWKMNWMTLCGTYLPSLDGWTLDHTLDGWTVG